MYSPMMKSCTKAPIPNPAAKKMLTQFTSIGATPSRHYSFGIPADLEIKVFYSIVLCGFIG
jgi:hypothetical protein